MEAMGEPSQVKSIFIVIVQIHNNSYDINTSISVYTLSERDE